MLIPTSHAGVVHHQLGDYTVALSQYNLALAKNDKFWSAIANIATFSGLLLLSTADAGTFNQSHHPSD